jgi:hypothetical protein
MADPLIELGKLMAGTQKTEVQCGQILVDAFPQVLLPFDETVYYAGREIIQNTGRVDIVVLGDKRQLDGTVCRVAYVWELKAPQVAVFEVENGSRARPTEELFNAENQLLHYRYECAGSEQFRKKWNITSAQNVFFGGIVIGTTSSFVSSPNSKTSPDANAIALANTALDVRKMAFYEPTRILLQTWTTIVARIPIAKNSHRTISSPGPTAAATPAANAATT